MQKKKQNKWENSGRNEDPERVHALDESHVQTVADLVPDDTPSKVNMFANKPHDGHFKSCFFLSKGQE